MRIGAVEKMGYYPTPPKSLTHLAHLIRPAHRGRPVRFLDPCAGQGEALAAVAASFRNLGGKVHTYGVELSPARQAIAAGVLDECLSSAWEDVTIARQSISLLYLNPPYDTEAGEKGTRKRRLEYTFLQNTLKVLQDHALLVYIVPLKLLAEPAVAKCLAGYFEQIQVYALPPGEFEVFGQVVVFAYCKPIAAADADETQRLIMLGTTGNVPSLDECTQTFTVPPSLLADADFSIRKTTLSHAEIVDAVTRNGVHTTHAWQDLTQATDEQTFTPAVPLKIGHVSGLIASGQMGTVQLGQMLVKGRSVKVLDKVDEHGHIVANDSDKAIGERERFETRIFTLGSDGSFTTLEKADELQAFLNTHATAIAQAIAQRYTPRYNQPTVQEWRAVSRLLPGKFLPGRKEAGLLPAQKHVAIAASRSALAQGWADVIGEMGVGKTTISLATLALIPNAYPAIVLCPGHMVNKWAREAQEVIPGARGVVVNSLADLLKFTRTYRQGEKVVVVVSKERAKLGAGWQPATIQRRRKLRIQRQDPADDHKVIEAIETVTAHTCPACGAVVRDEFGLPLLELPPKRLFCTARVKKWVGDPLENTQGQVKETKCNAPLYTIKGFRRYPLSRFIRTKLRGFFRTFICDEFHMFKGKATDQASAYHDLVMATKYTINLTGTLFGGKSTDLFWLRYRIDPQVRRDFEFHDEIRWAGMYGRLEHTLQEDEADEDGKFSGRRRYNTKTRELPGTSPALFSRLLTSCIFVRITDLGWQLPSYDETIINLSMDDVQATQYNALFETLLSYIKVQRSASDYEHQVARKLLGVWLQTCLGRPNAGFRPETVMYRVNKHLKLPVPIALPMPLTGIDDPAEPDLIANHLACVPKGVIKKDDLVIEDYGEYALQLAPVVAPGALLPKEQWLVGYCGHEQKQRRKVLLYVRQTGTRDIQPRLQQILQNMGLTAVILPDNVEPAKREAWINERVSEIDVLITNPRKVETGLDLIQFATCIFYELDYSLYTLWQAMRRVWRLGQTRGVKVLFPVYRGTIESAALALMGQKMQAALLLYGDNAASAITAEAGDTGADFTAELATRLLAGEQLDSNGITGLLKVAFTATDDSLADLAAPVEESTDLPPTLDPGEADALLSWATFFQSSAAATPKRKPAASLPKPAPRPAENALQLALF